MHTKPLLASIIALTLSGGAWAAETTQSSEMTEKPAADKMESQQVPTEESAQPPTVEPAAVTYPVQASDLLGKEVRDPEGKEIGEVDDLRIEQNGQIYAIISVGGVLGMGEESMAVPYKDLRTAIGGEDYLIYTVPPKQETIPSSEK